MNSFLFGDRTWIDTMPTFKALLLKYPTPPNMTPPAGCRISDYNANEYYLEHNGKWINMIIYTVSPETLTVPQCKTIRLKSS